MLKKRNHALTSAAITTHVLTEAPALSYVQTPITSSTVHAQWDFMADFVKNEGQHLAKNNYGKTKGASLECINCLTQRLRPCTRSSVMPSLKKDSFGRLSNLSAVAIKRNLTEDKVFFKDYPKNQEAFTWGKFRLSLLLMIATANLSTHVRATCTFNTEELQYKDYFRAKLSDIDVLRLRSEGCKKVEFISIRGYNCTGCTAFFFQKDGYHAHTDSYWASVVKC